MSKRLRSVLLAIAVLAAIIGVIWIGQGTGYFPYPRSSFMIDQTPWAYRGAILTAAAIVAMAVLWRMREK